MKKITLLLLALCFSILSSAQITIKGTIVNDSIPLESASVIIKNSKKGVATNVKGQFKLEAKKGDTLSISYLGYETKELIVSEDVVFKVKLEEGGRLDAVIVNGFLDGRKISCGTICTVTQCSIHSESIIKENVTTSLFQIKLYPNPSSSGIFQLKLMEDYNEVKISVANISGQIVLEKTHQNFGEKFSIDLSQSSTGIYIINVIADGEHLEAIKVVRS